MSFFGTRLKPISRDMRKKDICAMFDIIHFSQIVIIHHEFENAYLRQLKLDDSKLKYLEMLQLIFHRQANAVAV
jgi:hypothetical protein